MVSPVHLRAFDSILRRVGEDAVLRTTTVPGDPVGDPPEPGPPVVVPGEDIRIHREYGVEMQGEHGELVIARVVATMLKTLVPRRGESLIVGADNYVIDAPPFQDNGVSVRVILREV